MSGLRSRNFKAVEQFKTDLPDVIAALRDKIEQANKSSAPFARAELNFLQHARETINLSVSVGTCARC